MSDQVLEALRTSTSYKALEDVLVGVKLKGLQTVDALGALYREKSIISYDTGMGKTYMAAAIIKMLLNEDPGRGFIILIKKKQITQTSKKISDCLGLPVLVTTGMQKDVQNTIVSGKYLDYHVLMITHSTLESQLFVKTLLKDRDKFCCLIIDEAHNLNNTTDASSADVLKGMCRAFRYRFALTATPITSDIKQYARLAHMLDPDTYPNASMLASKMKRGSFSIKQDPLFFIERTRLDFGVNFKIHGEPIFVEPMEHQIGAMGTDMVEICKGEGAVNQANALVDFILEHKNRGERGLVYVNRHSIRNWILPFLNEAGIKVGCINGFTSRSEDEKTMDDFNNTKQLDVVITSVTEAIDLDCDWVMFYEFTVNVEQMIGRSYRGFDDKELWVYFMFTYDTGEIEAFQRNIYTRSELIKRVLGKTYWAVFDTERKIESEVI